MASGQLQHFVKTHWFGTVAATLGSLVFFGGSLYVEEIKWAFPFYRGPYGPVSVPAVLFWAGLLVVTLMLAAKNAADETARQELVDATDRVKVLVQTLPPRSWREDYATAIATAADKLDKLLPRKPEPTIGRPELARVAQSLLGSIATLAYRFDDQPRVGKQAAVYAANIMVYRERQAADPFFDPAIVLALTFNPPDEALKTLRGILVLVPELSFLTAAENGPDQNLRVLALPIPSVTKDASGRWRVLPGAPMAFAESGVDGYADVATLPAWFDKMAAFPESIRDEVSGYFTGPMSPSKSFVSRRLDCQERSLGVLNLHSSARNILGARGVSGDDVISTNRREEFFALMTPIVKELESVVELFRLAPDVARTPKP